MYWLLAIALAFIIALALTAPLSNLKNCLTNLLRSDIRAFISVITVAFSVVVILSWINIFGKILILLSAAALARLDLQTSGFRGQQAFWIIAIASLIGLGLGLTIHLAMFSNIPVACLSRPASCTWFPD